MALGSAERANMPPNAHMNITRDMFFYCVQACVAGVERGCFVVGVDTRWVFLVRVDVGVS